VFAPDLSLDIGTAAEVRDEAQRTVSWLGGDDVGRLGKLGDDITSGRGHAAHGDEDDSNGGSELHFDGRRN
jgi:hypothetical protein